MFYFDDNSRRIAHCVLAFRAIVKTLFVMSAAGGGLLGLKHVSVKNGRKWVLFRHQVNEMNEKLSFKMGVVLNCTSSNYMGKNCLDI